MPVRPLSLPFSAELAVAGDARRLAPSAERNAGPILQEIRRVAPKTGRLLEIASGTGQHSAAFAAALPGLIWQPSDGNPEALTSIAAWGQAAALANLMPPILLDAARAGWSAKHCGYDLVFVSNLLHLVSWFEAECVVAEMACALAPGGLALIYGPFRRDGRLTSPGDEDFDANLRRQDPEIGYKDHAEVARWADAAGLTDEPLTEMPANNLLLRFRKPG